MPQTGRIFAIVPFLVGRARGDGENVVEAYCNYDASWYKPPDSPPTGATTLVQMQIFSRHGVISQAAASCPWGKDKSEGESRCVLSSLYKAGAEEDTQGEKVLDGPPFRVTAGGSPSCLPGQLALKGRSMAVNNGHKIYAAYKDRYPDVIPDAIDNKEKHFMDNHFQFRSTHIDRAMQSAMFFVNGMYCSGGRCDSTTEEDETINWVDLITRAPHDETMTPNSWICPASAGVEDTYLATLKDSDWNEMNDLCKLSSDGQKPTGKSCWQWLKAHIECFVERACRDTPFQPKNDTIPDVYLRGESQDKPFRDIFMVVDKHKFNMNKQNAKQLLGPLMKEILNATESATSSPDGRSGFKKFMLYMGDDDGPMFPLYAAFGLSPNYPDGPYWPAFGSYVALELWKGSGGGYIVRWLSNGLTKGDAMEYTDFKTKAQGMIPTGDDCKYTASSGSPTPTPDGSGHSGGGNPAPAPSLEDGGGGFSFTWLFVGFLLATAVWVGVYFAIVKPKLDTATRTASLGTELTGNQGA